VTKVYFEEATVGSCDITGPYKLTRDEIVEFATKFDPEPFHTDEGAASRSIFGGLTASSAHMFSVAYALSHEQSQRLAVLAALGIEEMEFPNPARPGDELMFECTILEKRESKSRPDRGIVRVRTVLLNQNRETVIDYKLKVMVARRPA
jgi:acyl dehydratase